MFLNVTKSKILVNVDISFFKKKKVHKKNDGADCF